jgi:hypothetical protein
MDVTYTGNGTLALNAASMYPTALTFTPSLPGTWTAALKNAGSDMNMYMYTSDVTIATNNWRVLPFISGVSYLTNTNTNISWSNTPAWGFWVPNKTAFLTNSSSASGIPGAPTQDLIAYGALNFSSSGPLPTTGSASFVPANLTSVVAMRIFFSLLI